MKRKTIYIAGPMRGRPNNNAEAFDEAHRHLAAIGWEPINPIDISEAFGVSESETEEEIGEKRLRAMMAAERAAIPSLDAIYLLKGWEESEGAKLELVVAIQNGLQVILEGEE